MPSAPTSIWGRLCDALYLFGRYTSASVRCQMQYKASFLLMSVGQLAATGMEFVGIWALFARFGSLRGWSLPEVAILYGIVNVAFAIADCLARGFDKFSDLVKTGDFDRLLVRPRSTALQVASRDVLLTRVGRLLQGTAVLAWAMHALPVPWTPSKLLLMAAAIGGGVALFYGLFVFQATLSFWTVENLEIMNALTYGSTEAGQYPLTIYRSWFRLFFTFVVPLACLTTIPARVLLAPAGPSHSVAVTAWMSTLVGFVFLALSLQAWRLGVRRYTSTGS
jgi:ABC-2 type transport system permease protein